MEKQLNVGIIGLGGRGYFLLSTILKMEGILVAVCDNMRTGSRPQSWWKNTGNTPFCTGNYKDILKMDEIDAVVVSTSWADHIYIAIDAMRPGNTQVWR